MEFGKKRKTENMDSANKYYKIKSKELQKKLTEEETKRNNERETTKTECFISEKKLKKCPRCKTELVLKFVLEEQMDNADCPCGLKIKILWDSEVTEYNQLVEEGLLQ